MKNTVLTLILLITTFSCVSNETPNTSKPSVNASVKPSPTPSSVLVTFATRKETAEYLKCQADAMREPGKPTLLLDLVEKMEKENPPIPDDEAIAIYNKHINDFIRVYPTVLAACPPPKK
jgi:propanediol dehydratase small subunit